MTERREQRAAREIKVNFSPAWQNDCADGFMLNTGILYVEGRYDAGTNSGSVEIKLFEDSSDVLQSLHIDSNGDYEIDVRAALNEWVKVQMQKYVTKILEVKVDVKK